MAIIAIGLLTVSIIAAEYKQKDSIEAEELKPSENDNTSQVWYMIILIFAEFLLASQFVSEAVFFEGYSLDPLYVIGMEGVFCMMYITLSIPFFIHVELCAGSD